MNKTPFHFSGLLVVAALIISACNVPVNDAPPETLTPDTTATPDLSATRTAQAKLIPTNTLTVTSTGTSTLAPSATSTPEPAKAEVVRESNCRVGPGALYDLVVKYEVGQQLNVVAKDLGGGYWFVQNPEKLEEQCYLLAQNIKITGDTEVLPKFTPLPSPTAAPYFEATFRKFDICENRSYVVFDIENLGSFAFRSVYIRVINQKSGESVEQAYNAFDLRVKCVLARNIAPLDVGKSGYVYSPQFKWSGHGERLRVIIMACTEKNLKGSCVTQSVDIKG
jgi:hypothetical protein